MNKIKNSISSMVKAIIIILIGVFFLIPTSVYASTGKSTGDIVNVREKPSSDSDVKEQLSLNDVVEILGEDGDWYKVNFRGTIGYVSKSFISTNDDNNNTQTSNEQKNDNTNNEVTIQDNNQKDNQENNQENNQINSLDETENNQSSNIEQVENTDSIVDNETEYVVKNYKMADNSKVKILPIVTAEEIGQLKKGENVSLVINAGLWVFVKSESISGWIKIDKLSAEEVTISNNNQNNKKDNENKTITEEKQQTVNYQSKTMYGSLSAINVRKESNTSSEAIDSIGLNTQVKVVGEENGWYKVEVNGVTGFIRKDLLSESKTEVTSRNNQLDRAEAQKATQSTTQVTVVEEQQTATVSNETSTQSVPVSSSGVSGSDIAEYAKQFVGCSYVYGAAGPNSFDCSGLTSYVYKHFGYTLHRSSRDQANDGVPVSGELQPGDILVFSNDGKQVGHVGIYIGNDKFVHASDSSTGVIISNLHDRWNINKYWGARRIIQ